MPLKLHLSTMQQKCQEIIFFSIILLKNISHEMADLSYTIAWTIATLRPGMLPSHRCPFPVTGGDPAATLLYLDYILLLTISDG